MNLCRAIAFLVVCAITTKTKAATVVFDDRAGWEAAASTLAVGGIQVEDFDSYANLRGQPNTAVPLANFSLTPLSTNQRVLLEDAPGQYLHNGSRYAFTSGQLRFDFSDPIAAFALDHKATSGSGLNSLEIFDAAGNSLSSYQFIPSQPVAFTGFLLDAGELAASIEISPAFGPTDSWSADNVAFAVPEPAARWLLSTMVISIALNRRRERRHHGT